MFLFDATVGWLRARPTQAEQAPGAGALPVSGFAGPAFLAALPWTGGAVAAVAAGTFFVARAAGRWNVVDTAWGLFFVAAGLAAAVASAGHGDQARRWLLAGLVTV